jgi:hypothetical protein
MMMTKFMIAVDIPNGRSVAEAEMAVKRAFDPDWVSEWWHIDDVAMQAESQGKTLTEEECREVLAMVMHRHDCNIGINWEVIDYWIYVVVGDRPSVECCICKDEFDREDLELVDDGSGDLICDDCMHPEEAA